MEYPGNLPQVRDSMKKLEEPVAEELEEPVAEIAEEVAAEETRPSK